MFLRKPAQFGPGRARILWEPRRHKCGEIRYLRARKGLGPLGCSELCKTGIPYQVNDRGNSTQPNKTCYSVVQRSSTPACYGRRPGFDSPPRSQLALWNSEVQCIQEMPWCVTIFGGAGELVITAVLSCYTSLLYNDDRNECSLTLARLLGLIVTILQQ